MKNYFVSLLILILVSSNGLAQDSVLHKKQHRISAIYFALNSGGANGQFIFGWGTGIIIKKGWGISFDYKASVYKAKLLPKDYYPGWDILGNDPIPSDYFYFYTISATKEFDSRWNKFKPGIETGVTYLTHGYYSNFQSIPYDYGLFGGSANYIATYKKEQALGLLIKPKVKFLLSKNIGIETSAWTILNKIENYYGIDVGLLIGRLK